MIAGVVATVLPRLTYAGEEARSYAFTAAAAAWLTLLLLWLIEGGGRRLSPTARRLAWLAYGAGMTVASYLFLYFVTLLVAHGAVLLATRASRPTAAGLGVVRRRNAWSPLLPLAAIAYARTRPDRATWARRPTTRRSGTTSSGSGCRGSPSPRGRSSPSASGRRGGRGGRAARGAPSRAAGPHPPGLVAATWLFLPTGLHASGEHGVPDVHRPVFDLRRTGRRPADHRGPPGRSAARSAATHGAPRPRPRSRPSSSSRCARRSTCSQRGPYAKNDSDWAEVERRDGARTPARATPSCSTSPPSPRSARGWRCAPTRRGSGACGIRRSAPRTTATTGGGTARTRSTQAAERGRFEGVERVWVIEVVDRRGAGHLGPAGAAGDRASTRRGRTIATHRSVHHRADALTRSDPLAVRPRPPAG